ncbi:NUDIX domain-containing protein [Rhodanobacter sp. 115]|uniref:NUDIX hydrolase n=1 Tax=Rhodanobacter sp. FW021-MT20 TaxID=1162282 RepID=UPI000260C59C|nr:NUDIX domain-containing protein [Rhodanobacter sp. 115]EIL96612.1 hydrolase, nudix family protein [Rhodanobacter sp. 115]
MHAAVNPLDDALRIRIVAAVIRDATGRVLLVRKRGAEVFQQPGGKRDPGDVDDLATLARELDEELGCRLRTDSVRFLCQAEAPAANERGHVVEGRIYVVDVDGEPQPRAEIEELRWVDPAVPDVPVAQLSFHHILPLLTAKTMV